MDADPKKYSTGPVSSLSRLQRLRERARVRVRSLGTTLTSDSLPPKEPKEGEEVTGRDFV
jgi:hypothetical protein